MLNTFRLGVLRRTTRKVPPPTLQPWLCSLVPLPHLLDYLIRLEEERRGDGEVERLGGLEVDDQLELGGLLYWQVRRLGTFENFVRIGGSSAPLVDAVCPIGEKATHLHKL